MIDIFYKLLFVLFLKTYENNYEITFLFMKLKLIFLF